MTYDSQGIQQQGRQNNVAEETGSAAPECGESKTSANCPTFEEMWRAMRGKPKPQRLKIIAEIRNEHFKIIRFSDHWSAIPGKHIDVFQQYWTTEINMHHRSKVYPDWSEIAYEKMNYKRNGKKSYQKRKKQQAAQKKEYRQRPEVKARHAERQRIYAAKDPFYRVRKNFRSRLNMLLKNGKQISTVTYLGCSKEEFMKHLESQFEKWMTWENYGTKWHVDHIMPCASFDHSDPKQIAMCWHFSNLRPLCAKKNASKGAKITHPQMALPI